MGGFIPKLYELWEMHFVTNLLTLLSCAIVILSYTLATTIFFEYSLHLVDVWICSTCVCIYYHVGIYAH